MTNVADPVETRQRIDGVLAELISELAGRSFADLPASTQGHVALVFADTVGVMLAGGSFEPARQYATRYPSGGSGRAQLVQGGVHADPLHAAFVNGTCGTVPELDELIVGGGVGGHPSMHIVPAVVAVAQEVGASGGDLLRAYAMGYEVCARVFRWYELDSRVQPHGHIGTVAAAAAVATLLDADPVEAARIASALPIVSLWDTTLEGASVHYTYTGLSASLGITAARLAASGFTGPRAALHTCFGELVGSPSEHWAEERPDPDSYLVETNLVKYIACCGRNFPAIDATLRLGPVDVDGIERIVIEGDALAARLTDLEKLDELTVKFSLEYAVCATLVHGRADRAAFAEVDPAVLRLVPKVAFEPLDMASSSLVDRSARVSVYDGQGVRVGVSEDGAGYLRAPLSRADLEAKFVSISGLGQERAAEVFDRLCSIAEADVVGDLW